MKVDSSKPIDYVTLWGEEPPETDEERNFFDENQAIKSKSEDEAKEE